MENPGEEPRLAYNRVAMTSYFQHRSPEELAMSLGVCRKMSGEKTAPKRWWMGISWGIFENYPVYIGVVINQDPRISIKQPVSWKIREFLCRDYARNHCRMWQIISTSTEVTRNGGEK